MFTGKIMRAVSDATIGTAIVVIHALLAERERERITAKDDRRRQTVTLLRRGAAAAFQPASFRPGADTRPARGSRTEEAPLLPDA